MIWVAWRQFRAQAVTAAIGLLLLGAWLLATGPGLADEYAAGLAACSSNGCDQFMDGFVDQHQQTVLFLTLVVLFVPAVLGLFWGAPLVARELEAGTHRLVWNQSVTRFRWLTVKLLLVGVSCAAVAGLVVWWVERWSTPLDDASQLDPRLPMAVTFAARGVVPLAYAVFAFALGVAAGMLTKRVIPAMAVTLAVSSWHRSPSRGWSAPTSRRATPRSRRSPAPRFRTSTSPATASASAGTRRCPAPGCSPATWSMPPEPPSMPSRPT